MTNTRTPHANGGQQTPAPERIWQAGEIRCSPPVTGTLPDIADGSSMQPPPREAPAAAGWADQAVLAAYREHYGSLVRQAAVVVRDIPTAEDVVQDSFIATHIASPRLENSAKALAYLRQSVANRSRSVLRHRIVVDQYRPAPAPDMPSAEDSALSQLEHSAVISALTILAPRQRQVLALKFFADMSEAQVADALGISKGTVKTHTSRALTSLRPALKSRA
jgi:RNA polymerase sigma-70 factor (sigma-E family)